MKYVIATVGIALLSVFAGAAISTDKVSATYNNDQETNTCTGDIAIPVNTIVRGDKDSEHALGTHNADNGEYKLTVIAINQSSEHPGTDIIVRSGNSEQTVKDVERKAFGQETADGTLTVSDGKVTAYVKLGKDKVFSGGVCVVLTLQPKEEPKCTIPGKEEFSPEDEECQEDPKEEKPEVEEPQVLPATGPGAAVATVATLSTAGGYIGHRLFSRRKL